MTRQSQGNGDRRAKRDVADANVAGVGSDVAALVARMRELHRIQRERDAARAQRERSSGSGDDEKAVQAGLHDQPENPLPEDQLAKPGSEASLTLAPRYAAPDYRGSGKLAGPRGDRHRRRLRHRPGRRRAVRPRGRRRRRSSISTSTRTRSRRGRRPGRRTRGLLVAGDVRDAEFCRGAVARIVARSADSTSSSTTRRSSCMRDDLERARPTSASS